MQCQIHPLLRKLLLQLFCFLLPQMAVDRRTTPPRAVIFFLFVCPTVKGPSGVVRDMSLWVGFPDTKNRFQGHCAAGRGPVRGTHQLAVRTHNRRNTTDLLIILDATSLWHCGVGTNVCGRVAGCKTKDGGDAMTRFGQIRGGGNGVANQIRPKACAETMRCGTACVYGIFRTDNLQQLLHRVVTGEFNRQARPAECEMSHVLVKKVLVGHGLNHRILQHRPGRQTTFGLLFLLHSVLILTSVALAHTAPVHRSVIGGNVW
ncbi:hypothetical protein ECC02_003030 [Trypanosoma cruzi]|uniref:Uncharacterized protein n=1 Tax=Trypanosoma cruzi TaxID=5693 RepID=A0A7J6YBQ1_TRYCR|nr:hypothetical protein ECC02_003030 [Trypanosoma cruzi]